MTSKQKKTKPGLSKKQTGFSLVEMMIGVAVLSVVTAGSLSLFDYMRVEMKRFKAAATKESLRNEIRQSTVGATAFKRSEGAPGNQFLKDCADAAATTVCDGSNFQSYTLLAPNGSELAGNNAYFDLDGAACSPWSGNCPFKVTMQVKPNCSSSGATTCGDAESATVRYSILVHSDLGIPLKPIIDDEVTSELNTLRNGALVMTCPSGSYMTGIGADGSVLCEVGTFTTTNGGGNGSDGGSDGGSGGGDGGSGGGGGGGSGGGGGGGGGSGGGGGGGGGSCS